MRSRSHAHGCTETVFTLLCLRLYRYCVRTHMLDVVQLFTGCLHAANIGKFYIFHFQLSAISLISFTDSQVRVGISTIASTVTEPKTRDHVECEISTMLGLSCSVGWVVACRQGRPWTPLASGASMDAPGVGL